jgi:SAM-dependent methyltransferase
VSTSAWDAASYDARHRYVFDFAADLITELDPRPGERILDLGCGTGHLTAAIARAGAEATGIDKSPEMIDQARRAYPDLRFEVAEAADYRAAHPFDAVFSNAALHWMQPPGAVAGAIRRALKLGGRFVAEFGGRGNIASIVNVTGRNPWFFPSVGEYASLLEAHGLEVVRASLFDRPTPIEGDSGLRDWLAMFYKPPLPPEMVEEAEALLRPKLFRDGAWWIDYRRLRLLAKRTEASRL